MLTELTDIKNCVTLFNKFSNSTVSTESELSTIKTDVREAYSIFASKFISLEILDSDNNYTQKQANFVKDIYKVLIDALPDPIPIIIPALLDKAGNIYTTVTIGTQQWIVENLKTTKYIDGTPIPNLEVSQYNDWFLPSKDELNAMYTELFLYNIAGFATSIYWESSERDSTTAYYFSFSQGIRSWTTKNANSILTRACRAFTSADNYNLRDLGPSGGYIFWKFGNDYLEAAPYDLPVTPIWSNVDLLLGTTGTAIGTGQANTTAIINQPGHTDSAAKLCNDLSIGGWVNDTTGAYCWYNNDISNKDSYGALYNLYTINSVHGLVYFERDGIQESGWRVSNNTDLSTLVTFLGGSSTAGGKMKEVGFSHWNSPNTGADDISGLTMLGAGIRNNASGAFLLFMTGAWFWLLELGIHMFFLNNNSAQVFLSSTLPGGENYGFSIRCVRDI
jgi:uncharacterized protein (TIGR02145 family)